MRWYKTTIKPFECVMCATRRGFVSGQVLRTLLSKQIDLTTLFDVIFQSGPAKSKSDHRWSRPRQRGCLCVPQDWPEGVRVSPHGTVISRGPNPHGRRRASEGKGGEDRTSGGSQVNVSSELFFTRSSEEGAMISEMRVSTFERADF